MAIKLKNSSKISSILNLEGGINTCISFNIYCHSKKFVNNMILDRGQVARPLGG